MTVFRLIQISDSHLSRRLPQFTENFRRVSEYIDSTRPDLVVNSGDLGFDGYEHRDDLEFAKEEHDALPVDCRYLPGNHGGPFCRFSARTAGASTLPAGASSDWIR
jgi:3',5'-cyclic AMP phosphodiesterase CpdA